jgi:prepilin-type N-terminal cleavage/methylation domain-containing protein
MRPTAISISRKRGGFTMIEVMLALLIISLLASIAIPYLNRALQTSARAAIVADSRELYTALMRYRVDTGEFPSIFAPPETAFNTQTLAPLSTSGYFEGVTSFLAKVWRGRIPAYLALSSGSPNDQFWSLIRSKKYKRMWLLVAHTDRFPLQAGTWYDGVYILQAGGFVRVDKAK